MTEIRERPVDCKCHQGDFLCVHELQSSYSVGTQEMQIDQQRSSVASLLCKTGRKEEHKHDDDDDDNDDDDDDNNLLLISVFFFTATLLSMKRYKLINAVDCFGTTNKLFIRVFALCFSIS